MSGVWQPTDWLALNAAWTAVEAKFEDDQGDGREIPGAVDSTFTLGANAAWANGVTASARLRYLGEAPLVEDDSVRTGDSLLVNAGIAYRRGDLELRLDAFNLFDSFPSSIQYTRQAQLDIVARKLNTRPRKTLDWKTPADIFETSVSTTH